MAHQCGVLQDVLPPLKLSQFQVQFTSKDHDYKRGAPPHQTSLACLPHSKAKLADELEGKEMTYHATTRYIHWHKGPNQVPPKDAERDGEANTPIGDQLSQEEGGESRGACQACY